MSNSFKYSTALYPDKFRVLGRTMEDYTVGHALLLERLQSPFVTGGRTPGRGDVKLFLAVCRRPYPRALELVRTGRLAWRLRLIPCGWERVPQAVVEILRYLAGSIHMPHRWEKEGEKPAGTPPLQQVKLTHMSKLGKSPMQALCTPIAEAYWDFFGTWEMEGKMQLSDPDDLEAAREVIEEARREHRNGASLETRN